MKTMCIYFEDEEFEKLLKHKEKGESWREFILRLVEFKEKKK